MFGSTCFCFVDRSSVDWNECNRAPNFGGRFVSSWNFRCDSVACFSDVRWLWLKTDFIVFERNRLFVRLVCTRHPLGPTSSANFDARTVSRWISSMARLKCVALNEMKTISKLIYFAQLKLWKTICYLVNSVSFAFFEQLVLSFFFNWDCFGLSSLSFDSVDFADFCLFRTLRSNFWASNCFFIWSDDIPKVNENFNFSN